MSAAVIAGRDPAPIFEFGEHVLNLVPLPMQRLGIGDGHLAALGRRNARRDVLLDNSLPETVAIVASVNNQGCARRQRSRNEPSALMVAHLTFRQKQDVRLAGAIADGVELGVQPARCSADSAVPYCATAPARGQTHARLCHVWPAPRSIDISPPIIQPLRSLAKAQHNR